MVLKPGKPIQPPQTEYEFLDLRLADQIVKLYAAGKISRDDAVEKLTNECGIPAPLIPSCLGEKSPDSSTDIRIQFTIDNLPMEGKQAIITQLDEFMQTLVQEYLQKFNAEYRMQLHAHQWFMIAREPDPAK